MYNQDSGFRRADSRVLYVGGNGAKKAAETGENAGGDRANQNEIIPSIVHYGASKYKFADGFGAACVTQNVLALVHVAVWIIMIAIDFVRLGDDRYGAGNYLTVDIYSGTGCGGGGDQYSCKHYNLFRWQWVFSLGAFIALVVLLVIYWVSNFVSAIPTFGAGRAPNVIVVPFLTAILMTLLLQLAALLANETAMTASHTDVMIVALALRFVLLGYFLINMSKA
jgi:hypothetical protein